MKRALVAIALLALTAVIVPGASRQLQAVTAAAAPAITVEQQAWWSKPGITVPAVVGHHIHVAATIPRPGTIVNGRVDVPVHLVLHDQVGSPNWIRWQDGPDTKGQIPTTIRDFTCTPHPDFTDCARDMVLPVDFSSFGTGLRELRISLNVPDEQPDASGSQRMFGSFGLQVCVRSCSPVDQGGRSIDFLEARGWYDDAGATGAHGYQNARITSGIDSIRAGGTVTLKLAPGSGGLATKYSGVYIDPDMHHHLAGQVLLERAGSFAGAVTIPANLTPGPHKFVALASDGKNAGVIAITFQVGGDLPSSSPPPSPTAAPSAVPSATSAPSPTAFPSVCVVP